MRINILINLHNFVFFEVNVVYFKHCVCLFPFKKYFHLGNIISIDFSYFKFTTEMFLKQNNVCTCSPQKNSMLVNHFLYLILSSSCPDFQNVN